MTATGWCDGLRTIIAFVFTRPQPSVTPGTGPALKYALGPWIPTETMVPAATGVQVAGLSERGNLEIQTSRYRYRESAIAVAQGVGLR